MEDGSSEGEREEGGENIRIHGRMEDIRAAAHWSLYVLVQWARFKCSHTHIHTHTHTHTYTQTHTHTQTYTQTHTYTQTQTQTHIS